MNYLNLLVEYYREMESRDRLRWGIGIAAALILALCYSALDSRIALLARKRDKAAAHDGSQASLFDHANVRGPGYYH